MLHAKKREGLVFDVTVEMSRINDRGRFGSGAGHTAFYLMPPMYGRVVYYWSRLASKLVLS